MSIIAAEDLKPTLAEPLEREKREELDDKSPHDAGEQIDAARERFLLRSQR